MDQTPPKVFISYSWDSDEHKDRVWALAERLRKQGVDCDIDQYNQQTQLPEGWYRWMRNQLKNANFVLVVCTQSYYQGFWAENYGGRGVPWEGAIITEDLYRNTTLNYKYIPVLFTESGKFDDIPDPLRSSSYYELDKQYEDLYRHLTNQQDTPKSELGKLQHLPPRKRSNPGAVEPLEVGADHTELSPEAVDKLPSPKELHAALMDAFPDKSSLNQMLYFQLDKNLDEIAGGINLKEIVFNLIRTAQAEGWVEKLIRAAREFNPGNPRLLALDLQLRERKGGIVETQPSNQQSSPPQNNPIPGQNYEVQPGETLMNIAVKAYGKGNLYWKIQNANEGLIRNDPHSIRPGMWLYIP